MSTHTLTTNSIHGYFLDIIFSDELAIICCPPVVVDPKLERQYNFARATNNKKEMARLEKMIRC